MGLTKPKKIAVIDDEEFYRMFATSIFETQQIEVQTFSHTDDFITACLAEGADSWDWILVDRFGETFDAVADKFAQGCRKVDFKGPIFLWSNLNASESELEGFTAYLNKTDSLDWDALAEKAKTP